MGSASVHLDALSVMEYAGRVSLMLLTSVNQHAHQVPTARVQISAFLSLKMHVHHIAERASPMPNHSVLSSVLKTRIVVEGLSVKVQYQTVLQMSILLLQNLSTAQRDVPTVIQIHLCLVQECQ